MKIGITLDNWKLPVFRQMLSNAGYVYKDAGALIGDTTLLTVETEDRDGVQRVLERAQAACRRQGKPS